MTQWGRTMLSWVSRVLEDAGRVLATGPATLIILVPKSVPDPVGEVLANRIRSVLQMRACELGFPGFWVSRQVREGDRTCVAVRLEDRPVALVPTPYSASAPDTWIDSVVEAVDTAVRRRLSVLADIPALLATIGIHEPHPAHIDAVSLLLDCGVSWKGVRPELFTMRIPRAREMDLGEHLIDELAPSKIVLEVPEATLRSVDPSALDAVVRMRARLYADRGIRIPEIHLAVLHGTPSTFSIRLNDVVLRRPLSAADGWSDVVEALHDAIREVPFWFVRISQVRYLLEQLEDALPNLVELVERNYSDARLTGCLREIVRQGDSARNLQRCLWLMIQMVDDGDPDQVVIGEPILLAGPASVGRVTTDSASLAAAIRRIDAEEETEDLRHPPVEVVVPHEIEEVLRRNAEPADVARAQRALLDKVLGAGEPSRVEVGHADAVPSVRAALQPLLRPPRVVARQELPLVAR